MYYVELTEECKALFEKLDNDIQIRISKKIAQIEEGLPGRHLKHGLGFFVEDVGQYRICYASLENTKVRRIHFIGNHKEYGKWIENQDAE
jgi:mRNA-degrading endonuclease RelE of RelBE toxin-antitoxin system